MACLCLLCLHPSRVSFLSSPSLSRVFQSCSSPLPRQTHSSHHLSFFTSHHPPSPCSSVSSLAKLFDSSFPSPRSILDIDLVHLPCSSLHLPTFLTIILRFHPNRFRTSNPEHQSSFASGLGQRNSSSHDLLQRDTRPQHKLIIVQPPEEKDFDHCRAISPPLSLFYTYIHLFYRRLKPAIVHFPSTALVHFDCRQPSFSVPFSATAG